MAIIAQKNLFSWEKLEKLPDLKRLEILFKNIPDEKLMRKLERNRKMEEMITRYVECGTRCLQE